MKKICNLLILGIVSVTILYSCSNYESDIIVYEKVVKEIENLGYKYIRIKNGNFIIEYANGNTDVLKIKTNDDQGALSKVKLIKRSGDCILFVLGGAVDDDNGLLYAPKHIVDIREFYSIKEIKAFWYEYTTL